MGGTDDAREDSRLSRPINPMPGYVREALDAKGLTAAYQARPAYQRNDYIGWVVRARRAETRQKRLEQMLKELAMGGVYMNMRHPPSSERRGASPPG